MNNKVLKFTKTDSEICVFLCPSCRQYNRYKLLQPHKKLKVKVARRDSTVKTRGNL